MPTILLLLFVTMPVVAALSLDIGLFVPLMVLFCLVAGLSSSPVDEPKRLPSNHDVTAAADRSAAPQIDARGSGARA